MIRSLRTSFRVAFVATATVLAAASFLPGPAMASGAAALAAGAPTPETVFPLREKYAECTPIDTATLSKQYEAAIIVDVRNEVEYDVIHVTKALNVRLADLTEAKLESIRAKDGKQPLVFYCNGTTCSKSYKACRKAVEWGFQNVFVYDAGVFEWANFVTARASFFGKPMSRAMIPMLISKENQAKVALPAGEWIKLASDGGWSVYDVRDPADREAYPIALPGIKPMRMDAFIKAMNAEGSDVPMSKMLFVDNVGKQVKWLHYYLKRSGRSDFYFVKDGVRGWKESGYDGSGQPVRAAAVDGGG